MTLHTAIEAVLKEHPEKVHPRLNYEALKTPIPSRVQQKDLLGYTPWDGGTLNRNFSMFKELRDHSVLEYLVESESPELWLPQLVRSILSSKDPNLSVEEVEKRAKKFDREFPANWTFLPFKCMYAIGLKKVR